MNYFDLYAGDSLENMRGMKDGSVNLVITSPPYADARKSTYGGVKADDYVEWFMPYSKEIYRVLDDNGSFILNIKEKVVNGQRHTYVMELVLKMIKDGWMLTDEFIWHKTTGMPGKWPNRFRDAWEHCYQFTKNKNFTMNQEAVMVPTGDWVEKRKKHISENDKKRHISRTGSGMGRNLSAFIDRPMAYPSNVLHGSPVTRNTGHSAAYPVWLPEWFIKLFSNEGDIIFDPFIGSGTTAIAALNLKRNAIGCEILDEYVTLCEERVTKKHPKSKITTHVKENIE